jgi:hypothetical protein
MANTQNQTNNSQSSIKSLILTAIILSIFTIAALIGFISIYISIGKSNTTSVYWNKYESNISNIEYPNWFYIDRDSLYVNKTVSSKDKIILYNLISMQDSSYCEYKKAIDLLAFKSYQHTKLNSLVYLILLISFIGCMTRSLHDFYGRLCFKDGIDLSKWWSWYSIRPVIALNIGIILFIEIEFNGKNR